MLVRFFGKAGSARRYVLYALIGVCVFSAFQCGRDCSVRGYGLWVLSTVLGVVLVIGGLFLQTYPVTQMVRTTRHLRRVRAKLDPVAEAIGAKASVHTQYDPYYRLKLEYSFPDGNFVVIEVHPEHINSWTPNWNPGHEKSTEGLPVLMGAIKNLQHAGG